MSQHAELTESAGERIARYRMGDLVIRAVRPDGTPAAGRRLRIEQQSHQFLFGCNIYKLSPDDTSDEQLLYQQRFRDLLNYATLPFYWGSYEPEQGKTQEARLRAMADWCRANGIRPKGHPLVWHEVWPKWAPASRHPAQELLESRVRDIVSGFSGTIDCWDVINEATVSHRHDNGIGDWVRQEGCARVAARCIELARSANPAAVLLVNDFNVSPEYEAQLEDIICGPGRPDVIGIQSHMHGGNWPLERVWNVCETYARFGLPLHFTEVTVLSGKLIPPDVPFNQANWEDWPTTAEGEERQLHYAEAFYTLLFSHPAVEAVTWWDLTDGCWKNAPAGLVRRDLSPKPAYERLREMIWSEWRTRCEVVTDAEGLARVRAFYGSYLVRDGQDMCRLHAFDHRRGSTPTQVTVAVR
jgi:endo-1,4-beta-xylanase